MSVSLAIFLTNALTGWHQPEQLTLHFPELQQEHDAAQKIKTTAKIIVILGNPPYNRFAGVPVKEEADLVNHYKGIRRDDKGRQIGSSTLYDRWGIRKHLLNDLYIRFFRLAEKRIGERAEFGVVSFISNSSYLTGRSHPIMRESLLHNFHKVWIDDLHGNRLASERTPWGESCQTIFSMQGGSSGIKVGTCISTWLKAREEKPKQRCAQVFFRNFWGGAEQKRQALLESLDLETWTKTHRLATASRSEGPRNYEEFSPSESQRWKLVPRSTSGGFEDWPALDELFPIAYQGVNPRQRAKERCAFDTRRGKLVSRHGLSACSAASAAQRT